MSGEARSRSLLTALREIRSAPGRVAVLESELRELRDRVAALEATTQVLEANAGALEGVRDEVRALVTEVAEELNRRAQP